MQRFSLQEVSDTFCKGLYKCPELAICLDEFDCVGSTNAVLIDMARCGAPIGTVVWAHRQESGRGRLGRSFSSPEGGVYISMLLPCPKDPKDVGFALTAKTGVAVRRAIMDVCAIDCGIKWVNDIVVKGRKVCGVLAQLVARDDGGACVVMGIGVNYCTPMSCFDEGLSHIVGSLYDGDPAQTTGFEDISTLQIPPVPPMRDFVFSLIGHVYGLVCGREIPHGEKHCCKVRGGAEAQDEMQEEAKGNESDVKNTPNWLHEYKSSSTILGNEVKVIQAGKVVGEGVAASIDDDCHLHVRLANGDEMVLSTGEVSVRDGSTQGL